MSYALSASYYDALYAEKDYAGEVQALMTYLEKRGLIGGKVLDVACGTGRHLEQMSRRFQGQGLDLEPNLLRVARLRLPDTPLHEADMLDFNLDEEFDLVTCWFGSIGYLTEPEKLDQALRTFARHLRPSGWIAVERWLYPEEFRPRYLMGELVDEPLFKVCRMATSRALGTLYSTDFHYLVANPEGVRHFSELHQLRMYSDREYRAAFTEAGLRVTYEPSLGVRGMYLGRLRPEFSSSEALSVPEERVA